MDVLSVPHPKSVGVSRRTFALGSIGTLLTSVPLLASSSRVNLASTNSLAMPRLGVIDETVSGAAAFEKVLKASDIETLRMSGDVTRIWQDRLRTFWDGGEKMVFGLTLSNALFCLTMIARDNGYRLIRDTAAGADLDSDLARTQSGKSLELTRLPLPTEREARLWVIAHRRFLA